MTSPTFDDQPATQEELDAFEAECMPEEALGPISMIGGAKS